MGTWEMTAAERASLVDALAALPAQDWDKPSWCGGWSVRDVAGHICAAAYETKAGFVGHLAGAGFKFDKFTDKGVQRMTAGKSDKEVVEALRARIGTRNSPPGPTPTWLGEVVIHGEDIFRALGQRREHPVEHVVAVADFYKNSNLVVGAKKRVAGLTLKATDTDWTNGSGPEVSGPVLSLVMTMTGRKQALGDLAGDGLGEFSGRF
jgi:uncharacterized protein (TIGR03083 family)